MHQGNATTFSRTGRLAAAGEVSVAVSPTAAASHGRTAAQVDRLSRYGVGAAVDVHCHVLPGLDDGPAMLAGSIALCRALADDGVTDVIATPHQLGEYAGANEAAVVRTAVADLQRVLTADGVPLTIWAGAEVRVDERMPRSLDGDQSLTLADAGRYVLLELPHHFALPPVPVLRALSTRGLSGILAHPERQSSLAAKPELARRWFDAGAALQVTAGSLLGAFGRTAEAAAWHLLEAGLVSLVATDAHHPIDRPPVFTRAMDAIAARLGHSFTRRVCCENPLRVLRGQPLLPGGSPRGLEVAGAR